MNHKAKAIAGGFVILYKTWRHDKSQRQGKGEQKDSGRKIEEKKPELLFFTCAQEKAEMIDKKKEK